MDVATGQIPYVPQNAFLVIYKIMIFNPSHDTVLYLLITPVLTVCFLCFFVSATVQDTILLMRHHGMHGNYSHSHSILGMLCPLMVSARQKHFQSVTQRKLPHDTDWRLVDQLQQTEAL